MRTWAKSSALLAAAVMSLGAGTAYADTGENANVTSGGSSVIGGNQVGLPIKLPIDLCGNAVSLLSQAEASCGGGASVIDGQTSQATSRGVTSTGRSTKSTSSTAKSSRSTTVSKAKKKATTAKSTSTVRNQAKKTSVTRTTRKSTGSTSSSWQYWERNWGYWNIWGVGGNYTDGQSSVGGGNQVVAPINAPISICGNAVAVLTSQAFANCAGGAVVAGAGAGGAGQNVTSGQGGALAGNQVIAPVNAPVNLCGNAVAVLGRAEATCGGGAVVAGAGGAGQNVTSGQGGALAGNQVIAPVNAPISVCGNAVAVLGDASGGCAGGSQVTTGRARNGVTGAYGGGGTGVGGTAAESAQLLPALPLPAPPQLLGGLGLSGSPAGSAQGQASGGTGQSGTGQTGTVSRSVTGRTGVTEVKTKQENSASTAGSTRTPASPAQSSAGNGTAKQSAGQSGGLLNPIITNDEQGLRLVGIRLMSAERPADGAEERSGSLLALVMAALFAVPVALLARTRSRLRIGRR